MENKEVLELAFSLSSANLKCADFTVGKGRNYSRIRETPKYQWPANLSSCDS